MCPPLFSSFFFFNDTATTEIYTLSLHDALPIRTRLRYPQMRCYRHPDRETGLSCSECGRPICTDCMTVAPVGLRCPEHASQRPRPARVATRAAMRAGLAGRTAIVTQALIAINVGVYLIQLGMGAGVHPDTGKIFEKGVLYGPFLASGDWWRLITS